MRALQLGWLLIAAVELAACGLTPEQKDQVATFSSATDAIGTISAAQFTQLRQDIIQMNTEYLILGKEALSKKFDFDGPLHADAATQRVLTVNALQSYGDTLNKLVTADESGSIKKAATDLVANFNSATSTGLTNSQQSAGVDLISSLGGLFVDRQKKQAVLKIVANYACPVDQLAALLERDFLNFGATDEGQKQAPAAKSMVLGCPIQLSGDRAVGALYGYEASAGRLENAALSVISDPTAGFERRREAARAYILARQNENNGLKIGAAGIKAVEGMRKANAGLATAVRGDQLTTADIKNYATTVKQFVATVKVLTK